MLLLKDLADAAEIADEQVRFESEMFCAENLYYYSTLPDSALEALFNLIAEDDSEEIIRICTQTFWNKAESFSLLDPGFEEEYSAALSARSYDELAAIVEARSFAFIEKNASEVMARKAYIGTPEPADLERMLEESLSFLDDVEWNMTDARRILIYGY